MLLPRPVRVLLLAAIFALSALLVAMLWLNSQTVTVYRARQGLERYTRIAPELLEPVTVPRPAAAALGAITDPARLAGRYTARPMAAGDLFQTQSVVAEPPCERPFATGRCLPPGRLAYAVPLPAAMRGLVGAGDLVSVWGVDTRAGTLTLLLQKMPPLEIVGGEPERLLLALTVDEVAVVEGWLAGGGQEGPRRLLVTLTQPSNPTYERLLTLPFEPGALLDGASLLPPPAEAQLDPQGAPAEE